MRFAILTPAAKDRADEISKKLYSLSAPDEGSSTTDYCSSITHPISGDVALCMPNKIDLHIDASTIDSSVSDMFGDAFVTAALAADGDKINPLPILPNTLISSIKTRSEMSSEGWFPFPFGV